MIAAAADDSTGAPDRSSTRQDRLAHSVAALRRRREALDVERLLLLGGSVLLPTGVVVILLGWFGASHTSYAFEQTPYLISGGMLGTALTVAGGFLYFGYWLTRLVHEGRRERIELVEVLNRLDGRLANLEALGASTASAGEGGRRTPPARAGVLVVTATGSLVHRGDCPLVLDKDGLRRVAGDEDGLRPCKVCQPFAADDSGPVAANGTAATSPVRV